MKPQYERVEVIRYGVGIVLLGQEKVEQALTEFKRARGAGNTGPGEFYARAYDVRGLHEDADKIYHASTTGRDGWQGEAGVVTWIDRGQWQNAADAADAWLKTAVASDDVLGILRARAAIASVAVMSKNADGHRLVRELLEAVDANAAKADAIYPPTASEIRLYAGLLSAQMEDAAGVAAALLATQASNVPRDYPTVRQLQQVVLAEQERLDGKSQAAVSRMRSLVKRDDALVAVHWALMRAEGAAGNSAGKQAQITWLVTHRGRVFTEATTIDVLRFFNAAVSAEALKANNAAQVATKAAAKASTPAVRATGVPVGSIKKAQ